MSKDELNNRPIIINKKNKKIELTLIKMKSIKLFKGLVVILILTLVFSPDTYGQSEKSTKGPPAWAPAHGYRANTTYIYFPDQNVYFDLQKSVYISLSGNNWQIEANLPLVFSGVDLSIAAKIELDLTTDTPQQYNSDHKAKYKGKGEKDKSKDKSSKGKSKKN